MYYERIKFIIRQADPCDKTGDATKGVGVAKFDFTNKFRNQLFSHVRYYTISTRLQITVKVF